MTEAHLLGGVVGLYIGLILGVWIGWLVHGRPPP